MKKYVLLNTRDIKKFKLPNFKKEVDIVIFYNRNDEQIKATFCMHTKKLRVLKKKVLAKDVIKNYKSPISYQYAELYGDLSHECKLIKKIKELYKKIYSVVV